MTENMDLTTSDGIQVKPSLCAACPNLKKRCVTIGRWDDGAKLTFLLEFPSWPSLHKGPSGSVGAGGCGILLRKLIEAIDSAFPQLGGLKYNLAYAVGSPKDGKDKEKPSKEQIDHCRSVWQTQWIDRHAQQIDRHVIVPMGMIACKGVGITARKILDIRGSVMSGSIGQKHVTIVPTLSIPHIYAKPGLSQVVQSDVMRAVRMAYMNEEVVKKPVEELAKTYVFPKTIEEVRALCDLIIGYTDPAKQPNPMDWPISVDTETNTLKPFRKDAKILMMSFGWDEGKSCAILLDHIKNTWYDPKLAWAEVKRVLECPKPKSLANCKYDLQFIERVYGIRINNLTWDTMCGEHWLYEDKKGVYGLKALAPMYCPEYEGYEDALHDLLREGEESAPTEQDALIEARELSEAAGTGSGTVNEWIETITEAREETADDEEEEEEADPNEGWRVDPVYPAEATSEQVEEYRTWRETWFKLDLEGKGKERGQALKKWKKAAMAMSLPPPDPTPAKKVVEEVEVEGVIKDKDRGFSDIALETLLPYAAVDTDVTRIIMRGQYRKINQSGKWEDAHRVMKQLYIPGSRTLGGLEFRGVRVDFIRAANYDNELTDLVNNTSYKLHDLALDSDFNVNAPQQLAEVMQRMGFEVIKLTKSKMMSTSKDVLSSYQAKLVTLLGDPERSPEDKARDQIRLDFVESLLLYRAATKMQGSFLKRLREYGSLDGHIHTTFHLTGTSTGRLSSARLNLQNLPKYMCRITRPNLDNPDEPIIIHEGFNVKALLVPENDEEVFWNLDIKQAELRVCCYYSGDQALIDALNDGLDIHTFFVTKIKHPELVGDALTDKYRFYKALVDAEDKEICKFRNAVKRVVFGTLYGAGPKKIAAQVGCTKAEAANIIASLFTAFPGIRKYIQDTKAQVNKLGYVKTVFGRYRRFLIAAVSQELQAKAEREAVNFRIQSTSSDLVLAQLSEIDDHLHEVEAVMRLTVHDSMGGTVKKSRVGELVKFFDKWLVERIKVRFPWLPVPFSYDLEIGPSYGETEKIKKWLAANANSCTQPLAG